jgi:selenocysteine lyase/cysteine desulfurase
MSVKWPYLDEESVKMYRREFPITKNRVFLNHAGVAAPSQRFCDGVAGWLEDLATRGGDFTTWRKRAARCRWRFANLIGCAPEEVAFVRNTSHGLSLVAEGFGWQDGDRVGVNRARGRCPLGFSQDLDQALPHPQKRGHYDHD